MCAINMVCAWPVCAFYVHAICMMCACPACAWCVPGVCLVCAWHAHTLFFLTPPTCHAHTTTHTTATCRCCRGYHRCSGVPKHPTRHAASAAGAAGAATPTAAAAAATHHMCRRHAHGRGRAHCWRTSRHARTLLPLLPVLLAATAAAAALLPLQSHMPAAFDYHFTKKK